MKYWTTATGEKIALNKLSDNHLQNIIVYLERNATTYVATMSYPNFSGEVAQECAESNYDTLQANPLDILKDTIYDDLLAEQFRREIKDVFKEH